MRRPRPQRRRSGRAGRAPGPGRCPRADVPRGSRLAVRAPCTGARHPTGRRCAVSVCDEVLHAGARPFAIVGEHAICRQAGGRAVEEHRWGAGVQCRQEVAVVAARRDDHDRVHATPQQCGDELALELRILLARARDQQEAVRASHLLHGLGDSRVKGVADVLDDQAERGGGTTVAQAPREVVALEPERGDRGGHARGGLVGNARFMIDHARNRLHAHPGLLGDVPHRWSRRSQRTPPSQR